MTDAQLVLFAAVLAQVALTLCLYLMLVRARTAVLTDKTQARPEMAYDQGAWPLRARLVSNSVASQFELPVLFYTGVLFAFQFGSAGWLAAILAWVFVASRLFHAIIHTGKNAVPARFGAFALGMGAVIVLWVYLAIRAFSAGGL